MPLDEQLIEANRAVGVRGSLLVSTEGEVLAAAMPATVDETKLRQMAARLAQSLGALDRSKRKTIELDLTFQDLRLLVRPLQPAYLVLLCQRNANLPLIQLSLGPILKKIAAELKPKQPAVEFEAPVPLLPPEPVLLADLPPAKAAEAPAAKATEVPAARELPPLIKRQITEAQLIVRAAEYMGVPLRVLGSAGAALHCGSGKQWMLPPSHNFVELGASGSAGPDLVDVFQTLEFLPLAKFNERTDGKRFIFHRAAGELWADVHCGAYEMYHRVEFEDVLTQEEMVLPATHTFLVRLQTVEANEADLGDLIALLLDHEVSVGPTPDAIDATLITALCAEDWGWHRTALGNLDRLRLLGSAGRLPASPHLRDRIEGLYQSIERAPKSVRWQMRARLGDSVRWYKTPLFPPQAAGKAAPG